MSDRIEQPREELTRLVKKAFIVGFIFGGISGIGLIIAWQNAP